MVDEVARLIGILSIDDIIFRAGGGRSGLSDREIIDALAAMWRIAFTNREEQRRRKASLSSGVRMPMNYEHLTGFHYRKTAVKT